MTLRRTPEDFQVEELASADWLAALSPVPTDRAAYGVYRVTKKSLSTPEVCQRLAQALKVRPGLVASAGLKDKHAVTVQHVTVAPSDERDPEHAGSEGARPERPERVEGPNWSAERLGFAEREARAELIEGNRFTITVRGLSRPEDRRMGEHAAALEVGAGELLVTNYFGDQRFASARHGAGFAAERLVRGDFEGALKLLIGTPDRKDSGPRRELTRACAAHWGAWKHALRDIPKCAERAAVEALERGEGFKAAFQALPYFDQQMAVESFQSHVWNGAVVRLIRALEAPTFDAPDDFGPLAFVPASAVPDDLRERAMPMPAAGLETSGRAGEFLRLELASRGLTMDELRIPGLRRPEFGAVDRPIFVRARNVEALDLAYDEFASPRSPKNLRRTLRFDLPRGAYATVLLRALGQ
ncbi:MAG: tRNA pseudouridine(13) synthase TruD [Planctomycetota bacterium]|nr:tRNA pseudouridine(13) synthase TruD [Planctomycetota bacterium]